jgi:threonine dehydrogenase-like Zn-dependent dehydrogenase
MEAAYGYSGSGLFGYSHMMGGYAGGQAQYVRVPFANVGPLKIESDQMMDLARGVRDSLRLDDNPPM